MVAEEEVVSPVQVEETVDVDRQIWENQQQLLIQLLVQIHLLIGSKFVLNQRYVFCCKNGILNTKGGMIKTFHLVRSFVNIYTQIFSLLSKLDGPIMQ